MRARWGRQRLCAKTAVHQTGRRPGHRSSASLSRTAVRSPCGSSGRAMSLALRQSPSTAMPMPMPRTSGRPTMPSGSGRHRPRRATYVATPSSTRPGGRARRRSILATAFLRSARRLLGPSKRRAWCSSARHRRRSPPSGTSWRPGGWLAPPAFRSCPGHSSRRQSIESRRSRRSLPTPTQPAFRCSSRRRPAAVVGGCVG